MWRHRPSQAIIVGKVLYQQEVRKALKKANSIEDKA